MVKNSRVRHVRRGRVQRLSQRQTRSREAIFAERSTDASVDSTKDAVQRLSQPPRARLCCSHQHATDASIAIDRRRLATVRRGPVATLSRWSVRRVQCLADGRVCRVEPRRAQLPQATDTGIVIPGASVARTPPRLSRVPTRCNSGEPTDARVASVAPISTVLQRLLDPLILHVHL
jgi:hypothetical protein